MSLFMKVFLAVILPLLWQILAVILWRKQEHRPTKGKFALVFVLSWSGLIAVILTFTAITTHHMTPAFGGFILFIFGLNVIIGLPIAYFSAMLFDPIRLNQKFKIKKQ